MQPALRPGDCVMGWKTRSLSRHHVVAFVHPRQPDLWLVKRIVALAGESINLDNGTIDGRTYDDPWRDELYESGEWTMPKDHVFVMSDNRAISTIDSRIFGPVAIDQMFRIAFSYWPIRHRHTS